MRPVSVGIGRGCLQLAVFVATGILVTGCGALARHVPSEVSPSATDLTTLHPDVLPEAASIQTTEGSGSPDPPTAQAEPVVADRPTIIAQRPPADRGDDSDAELEQYDPWERFNEKMFNFNIKLDRNVLKPVAKAYRAVVPDQVQVMIDNGFDNIRVVPRIVNNLLQAKFVGALSELTRFVLNSTVGFGGLFDVGKYAGIERRGEDFGQTLGVWGAGPGPYLVLPFIPPMTVRDGVGRGVDTFIDPLGYFVPFIPARLLMRIEDTINERALNYDLFQGVEETTLDLYSSVRHFYLNRRERQIRE